MIILITGNRNSAKTTRGRRSETRLVRRLWKYRKKISLIIEGGAKGIDQKALETAFLLGIQVMTVHANWERFGRAAGAIRNKNQLAYGMAIAEQMDESFEVWAWHHSIKSSKGTANQIKQAKQAKAKVRLFV